MSRNTSARIFRRYGPPFSIQESRRIATGVPGLRVRTYAGVEPGVRRDVLSFAAWLRRTVRFDHPVRVTLVAAATVVFHDGPGWGCFLRPRFRDHEPGDVIRIYVAAGAVLVFEREWGFTPERARQEILIVTAHELVHYLQWKRRRARDEAEANRRGEWLVRTFLRRNGGEVIKPDELGVRQAS